MRQMMGRDMGKTGSPEGQPRRKSARSRLQDLAAIAGVMLLVVLWTARGNIYNFGYDLWSRFVVTPRLAPAEDALVTERPGDALQSALRLLRADPDDPRLIYFVAGAYWNLDQPLLADFYTAAYLKSVRRKDPEQLRRLSQLLAEDERAWPYLNGAGFTSRKALGALIDSLDLEIDKKITIKAGAEDSAAGIEQQFDADERLYYDLPKGWQRAPALPPAQVLGEPADSGTIGYIQLGAPVSCDEPWCSSIFKQADLTAAIRSGRLAIDFPKGGADCCSLSLDDSDLRPIETIVAEFLARRQAAGKDAPEASAEGMNALLSLRQRVLFKQSYLLSFAAAAQTR
jgi:hypothetical protein